jgi:hypothetical protein
VGDPDPRCKDELGQEQRQPDAQRHSGPSRTDPRAPQGNRRQDTTARQQDQAHCEHRRRDGPDADVVHKPQEIDPLTVGRPPGNRMQRVVLGAVVGQARARADPDHRGGHTPEAPAGRCEQAAQSQQP